MRLSPGALSTTSAIINFIQVNLNGSWFAHQLLAQSVSQSNVDILILGEPYARFYGDARMCFSVDRKAAVGTTSGTGFIHDDCGSGQGFAWIRVGDLSVFNCYWKPGTTLAEYETFLGDLDQALRARGETRLKVGGDFNAWNTEWGSRSNNPRRELLSDFSASLDLILANTGDTPTFVRGEATSVIDVTFFKLVVILGWTVLDEINFSDHAYLAFSVDPPPADPHPGWPAHVPASSSNPGWALKRIDLDTFRSHMETT